LRQIQMTKKAVQFTQKKFKKKEEQVKNGRFNQLIQKIDKR